MKKTPLTLQPVLSRILRSILALALFSTLLAAVRIVHLQADRQPTQQPAAQESTQSQQSSKASADALAEASELSSRVVKLYNEKKYDEALPLAKRALELREGALGPDHELVQGALLNLIEIYSARQKYGEARKLVERLLKIYEKTGPEDANTAIVLDKLGFFSYVQEDFGKSEAAYKRALAIRGKAFGPDSTEFATSLYTLAELYRFTGHPQKAEPLYEQATLLRRKLLGPRDPEYLKAKDRYFCLAYSSRQEDRQRRIKEFTAKLDDPADAVTGNTLMGGVLNGQALSLPKPTYSEEARRAHARGTVVIKVTIDEYGNVIDASDMCGGNPLLVKPSLQSARGARFTPTKLSGQPVKVSGVITYNFVVR